jgi:hypothetical protein
MARSWLHIMIDDATNDVTSLPLLIFWLFYTTGSVTGKWRAAFETRLPMAEPRDPRLGPEYTARASANQRG